MKRSPRLIPTLAAAFLALAVPGAFAQGSGLVLRVGTTEDLDSLSPFNAYERAASEVFLLCYDSLVQFDAELKPVPALAESWTVSDDGKAWTFRLRKGVAWHDGKPFGSYDVKWTYETVQSSQLGMYATFLEGIESIETPDDLTVVIRTAEPKANMLQNPTPIVPRHIWEPHAAELETFEDAAMVGTGPFRFREWKKGQYYSLEANASYFGGAPKAKAIVFSVFANRDTLARSLASGELDAALNLYPDQVPALEKAGAVAVYRFSGNGFTQLACNSWDSPSSGGHPALRDPAVRRAIERSMDKKEILAMALGGAGSVGSSLVPECIPEWHYFVPDAELRSYDPEKAKAGLEAAGYRDGDGDGVREGPDGRRLDFRFITRSDNTREVKAGQMIQSYLKAIGIATTLSTVDDGALQDAINAGDYDLFIWGWGGDVDPTTLLAVLTSAQIDGNNEPRWSSPAYDDVVARQATLLDPAERRAAVREAQRLAYEAAPYIILAYDGDIQAVRTDTVEGLAKVAGGPVFYANTNVNYLRATSAAKASVGSGAAIALPLVAIGAVAALVALAAARKRRAGK